MAARQAMNSSTETMIEINQVMRANHARKSAKNANFFATIKRSSEGRR
jgi:hypothetical protein